MPRSKRHFAFQLVFLILLCGTSSLPAAESVRLSGSGFGGSWRWDRGMQSSRFVAVSRDSIWMWDVEPNANVVAGIPERGGGVRYFILTEFGPAYPPLPNEEAILDGDAGTAYNPDLFPRMTRTMPLIINLGATFRINRIRLFPRLDRENRRRFLQQFSVSTHSDTISGAYESLFSFPDHNPNAEPVVDRRFPSRDVRFIRIAPTTERAWELAEIEVYGDGTVPLGEYISVPMSARSDDIVWGKVLLDGGDLADASVVVQTRTGPDDEPRHFFRQPVEDVEQYERVAEDDYRELPTEEKGPIKPNPAWSAWASVANGQIRSPSLRRYLQARVQFSVPGTTVKQLAFEYVRPPVARTLAAEIYPTVVLPGEETRFTLSLQIHLKIEGTRSRPADTGFRYLQVRTDAQIGRVERVLIDDRAGFFRTELEPGEGFTVDLRRRIEQNGSFVQVVFTGRLFRDRTRFEVGALDRRSTDDGMEEAYQLAQAADIDADLPGGSLIVRLEDKGGKFPLIANLEPASSLFTPNGDGINDQFVLSYALLKLVAPAAVSLSVYDLSGRRVRQVYEAEESNGPYTHTWDGMDAAGDRVPPGLYLYEVQVEADITPQRRQGLVGVVY